MRSQTYRVALGHGAKPWVILSNNSRNRNLDTVLAARITTMSLATMMGPLVSHQLGTT